MAVIKRFNNAFGTTTDSPLSSTATTMDSAELPRLGVVDSANNEIARVTLDPERKDGAPEIIHVTSYDGSATSATIERGKEGTSQREHASGTTWEHGPTREDFADRGVRVYLGSDQSISHSTWTKVQIDSTTHDPHGLFDSANNVLSLDRTGMWLVTVGVTYGASTGGDVRQCAVAHNGARVAQARVTPQGSGWSQVNAADVIEVASGDTVEVQASQDSGGSLAVKGIERGTWVSAAYLGSA